MWTLIAIVALCLAIVLLTWCVIWLTRRHPLAPTVPVTRLDESNKAKGKLGEIAVQRRLSEELPSSDYQLFSNVYVPRPGSSRKTEIDHVVVSRFGVFAIETKTWPGLISSTRDPRIWKQQIGRSINDHDSPVEQNERQVRTLARHLGLRQDYVHGLVCFNGPNTRFANEMPPNVVHAGNLGRRILGYQKAVFNNDGVMELAEAVAALS